MYGEDTEKDTFTGKVMRYNNTGEHTQTIPHNNIPHILYKYPSYITENNNGDVVVSDSLYLGRSAVVVTERGGKHRFSYTGPPSGSRLYPIGICTDALSHILVSDYNTQTVQMISKDGEFLSYLLTRESPGGHDFPWSLSYDVNTHLLWVGSRDNNSMVSVYRYVNRHLTMTENIEVCDDTSVSHSSPSPRIPGYSQEEFALFSVKDKAKQIADAEEEIASEAKDQAKKSTEAAEKATIGTEERMEAESDANAALEKSRESHKRSNSSKRSSKCSSKSRNNRSSRSSSKFSSSSSKRSSKKSSRTKKCNRLSFSIHSIQGWS